MALTKQDVNFIATEIRMARQLAEEARQFEAVQALRMRQQEFTESEAAIAGGRAEEELDIRRGQLTINEKQVQSQVDHMKFLQEGDKEVPYGKYAGLFGLAPGALPPDESVRLSLLAQAAQSKTQMLAAQAAIARAQDEMKAWQYDRLLSQQVIKEDGELFKLTLDLPSPQKTPPEGFFKKLGDLSMRVQWGVPLPSKGRSDDEVNMARLNLETEPGNFITSGSKLLERLQQRAAKGLPLSPSSMGYAQVWMDKFNEYRGSAEQESGYKVEMTKAYPIYQGLENTIRGYNYLQEQAVNARMEEAGFKSALKLKEQRAKKE